MVERKVLFAALFCLGFTTTVHAGKPFVLSVHWDKTVAINQARISIQVCPEPPLLRGRPLHDKLFGLLKDLNSDYARFQPWFPYPLFTIPELHPPSSGKTFWNFKPLDALTEDFMTATKGHPVIVNYGALPIWMFKGTQDARLPESVEDIDWANATGTEFRDSTLREAADYQAQLAAWYIKGGFTDESGKHYESGHHYKFAYWEVGNEPDLEHNIDAQTYTRYYDAVVVRLKTIDPNMKFAGPAISNPSQNANFLAYFLDRRNHAPNVPIDLLTFHFYTMPSKDEHLESMQHTIFEQADRLLTSVRYINVLRNRLSPETKVAIDELGSMLPDPVSPTLEPIPAYYWNLSGAVWAYAYANLASLNVDVVDAAELIDYPGQVASTTLASWETGEPNARYLVVKMLRDNLGPGDRIVPTLLSPPAGADYTNAFAEAFVDPRGAKTILLINRRNTPIDVQTPAAAGATLYAVGRQTKGGPTEKVLTQNSFEMDGFEVAVLRLPEGH